MSQVYRSMEDNMKEGVANTGYDVGGLNAIKAEFNKCGCVYTMQLNGNNEITHIKPLVCGNYHAHNSGTKGNPLADAKDKCDTLSIANPDNVAFMVGHDKLLIGEDTSYHKNNAVWVYDMPTHSLTRIMTVPFGAETTGVYFH